MAGIAAMGTGVHAQCTANGSGNTNVEAQPGPTGLGGCFGDGGIQGSRLTAGAAAVDADAAKCPGAQPDHNTGDAAVTDQAVRTDPEDGNRHVGGPVAEEVGEIVGVFGSEEHLRCAAHTEPRQRTDRVMRLVAAPDGGQGLDQRLRIIILPGQNGGSSVQGALSPAASCSGRALAHAVMLPAPRQTTRSPGSARSRTRAARSPASARYPALRWPRA